MALPPALASHATTIVEQLPLLIECALRCDIENNHLQIECTKYRAIIQELENNISNERARQRSLREQIYTIRGIIESESPSPSIIASSDASIATVRTTSSGNSDTSTSLPSVLAGLTGSPISLRTKRKGIIFSDDVQVFKKVKLDTHPEASELQLRRFSEHPASLHL
ncbi:hypothetical protein QCA50_020037 [Cerrena zonata]|uniref:Uncharacterized protein n=1 Tax=Cerrena zonata TaxID=2478898 RepID=A0AAW0F9P6_9APHY